MAKTEEDKERIMQNVGDVLTSLPKGFEVSGRKFLLYPASLGKTYMLAPLYAQLDINKDIASIDPTLEMLRVVQDKREIVCKIISICTFDKRDDLGDVDKILERADFFKENVSTDDLTKILLMAMKPIDLKEMQDLLGITKENELMDKANKVKKDKSSLDFRGKTIFGSLIVPACEKLNMTPIQVIWEISYDLLRMLMSDILVSVYLSKDELKKVHIPTDRERINADTKEGMEMIKHMNWD